MVDTVSGSRYFCDGKLRWNGATVSLFLLKTCSLQTDLSLVLVDVLDEGITTRMSVPMLVERLCIEYSSRSSGVVGYVVVGRIEMRGILQPYTAQLTLVTNWGFGGKESVLEKTWNMRIKS
jgi:hypothetical protein